MLFSTSWENAFDLVGRLGIDWDVYARNGGLLLDYHRRGRLRLDISSEVLEGSLVEPLNLHQALLSHSLLCFDREASVRHFGLLARLVETTNCYRLHFGRNVLDLPRLVDQLLGRTVPQSGTASTPLDR